MRIPSERHLLSRRDVEIDIASRAVVVTQHKLLSKEIQTYPFSMFDAVYSYLHYTGAMWAFTRVELLAKTGVSGLLVAKFDAACPPLTLKNITSTYLEAPEAAALREKVASRLNIKDKGYLGHCLLLHQVRPDTQMKLDTP